MEKFGKKLLKNLIVTTVLTVLTALVAEAFRRLGHGEPRPELTS